MVVSVGEDIEPYDIAAEQPWSDANVTWRWVPREEFRQLNYHATVADRFKFKSEADVVVFSDADTLFIKGVDDVLEYLNVVPAIAGVIAHAPPFLVSSGVSWKSVFETMDRQIPPDMHQHTGWGMMFEQPEARFCPTYFNFGAVFVSNKILPPLACAYRRQLDVARRANLDYFVHQLALTLAIYELDLHRISLDLRYNFPNDPIFEDAYPQDLNDVRILHYLRTEEVQRDAIWRSDDDTTAFLSRQNLRPSNEALRRTVERLWTMEGGMFRTSDTKSSLSAKISALRIENERLAQECQSLREASTEVHAIRSENARLAREYERLEDARRDIESRFAAITASTFWRASAPARNAIDLVKRRVLASTASRS